MVLKRSVFLNDVYKRYNQGFKLTGRAGRSLDFPVAWPGSEQKLLSSRRQLKPQSLCVIRDGWRYASRRLHRHEDQIKEKITFTLSKKKTGVLGKFRFLMFFCSHPILNSIKVKVAGAAHCAAQPPAFAGRVTVITRCSSVGHVAANAVVARITCYCS